MRRPHAGALAAVAATVAIAGCGGGGGSLSNQDYAKQLKGEMEPLGKSLKQLQSQAESATSKQQLTSALGAADNAVEKASDGVDALDAPSDATGSNADLVTALDTYEKSIADTEETIRSGTKSEIATQIRSFQTDSQTFASSLDKIKKQLQSEGIKVGNGQ